MRFLFPLIGVLAYSALVSADDDTMKLGKTMQEWTAELNTEDAKRQIHACQVLGDWRRAAAPVVPALVKTLEAKDANVRFAAAGALGRIGPPAKSAVPALLALEKAPDLELRLAAFDALGGIGPSAKDAVPALVAAVGERETLVALAGLRALRHIGVASKEVSRRPDSRRGQECQNPPSSLRDVGRRLTGLGSQRRDASRGPG